MAEITPYSFIGGSNAPGLKERVIQGAKSTADLQRGLAQIAQQNRGQQEAQRLSNLGTRATALIGQNVNPEGSATDVAAALENLRKSKIGLQGAQAFGQTAGGLGTLARDAGIWVEPPPSGEKVTPEYLGRQNIPLLLGRAGSVSSALAKGYAEAQRNKALEIGTKTLEKGRLLPGGVWGNVPEVTKETTRTATEEQKHKARNVGGVGDLVGKVLREPLIPSFLSKVRTNPATRGFFAKYKLWDENSPEGQKFGHNKVIKVEMDNSGFAILHVTGDISEEEGEVVQIRVPVPVAELGI